MYFSIKNVGHRLWVVRRRDPRFASRACEEKYVLLAQTNQGLGLSYFIPSHTWEGDIIN